LRAETPLDLRGLRPWARRYDAIQIGFMGGEEGRRIEAALERDYTACGCAAGRVAFAGALLLLFLAAVALHDSVAIHPAEWALGGILGLSLVTAAATLASMVQARWRVNRTVNRLVGSSHP
jgi:hypothetical protein